MNARAGGLFWAVPFLVLLLRYDPVELLVCPCAVRRVCVWGCQHSRSIDAELARSAKEEDTFHKLLLLGAGESGKSTFFKQVQQLYGRGFHTEADRRPYLAPIHSNVIDSIKKLVEQARLMAAQAVARQQMANAAAAVAIAHAAANGNNIGAGSGSGSGSGAGAGANHVLHHSHSQAQEPPTPVSATNHTPTPTQLPLLNPASVLASAAAAGQHSHRSAAAAAAGGTSASTGGSPAAAATTLMPGAIPDSKSDAPPSSLDTSAAATAPTGTTAAATASAAAAAAVSGGTSASVGGSPGSSAIGVSVSLAGGNHSGSGSTTSAVPQLIPIGDAANGAATASTSAATAATAAATAGGAASHPTASPTMAAAGGQTLTVGNLPPPSVAATTLAAVARSLTATAFNGPTFSTGGSSPTGATGGLQRTRTKTGVGGLAAAAVIAEGSTNAVPVSRNAEPSAEFVMALPSPCVVTPEIAHHVKILWSDPAIKYAFEMRSAFQLPDTCAYLFERIDAIGSQDYVPSYEDVLHVRARTTGIAETTFGMDGGAKFRLMDVGGQRNERKKWINMFDKVTAVIFVVAMSEYDQMMFEDAVSNRMLDALQLFADTCNLRWYPARACPYTLSHLSACSSLTLCCLCVG